MNDSSLIQFKPNYVMLRSMVMQAHIIKNKYSELDQMPIGAICPGYDINIMQALAVLKYIYGVNTQWSCQGNHKDDLATSYILLAPNNEFPQPLVTQILNNGFTISQVLDYDENIKETGKFRFKISSCAQKNTSTSELIDLNKLFVRELNTWAEQEIKTHLINMVGNYYNDFKLLYQKIV